MKINLSKIYYTLVDYRSRPNYWSLSHFADYAREVHGMPKKLGAGTSEEFRAWDKKALEASPVGYWITEECLDYLQDIFLFIPDVYYNVRAKLRNIFIDQTHVIRTGLTPGGWYEYNTRMEKGLFNIIVEYVEGDQANDYDRAVEWSNDPRNDDDDEVLPFIENRREAGLAHLDWEIALDDPYTELQVARAKEVKDIYLWIKDIRPNRMDPHDHKEWREYSDSRTCIFDSSKSDEERTLVRRLLKEVNDIEQQQTNEDTEILIRIVKVRDSLWT